MRYDLVAVAATALILVGCGAAPGLAASSSPSDVAPASAAGLISPPSSATPAPEVTPVRSESPASTAGLVPVAASQARIPECTGTSVKATVGGVRYMGSYPIGQALTVTSTAVNVSSAPCQFLAGYCPGVQILGPAGITDRWYDTRGHGCADDHAGYLLLPGQSLTVSDVWDQKSCAQPSGTCPFQNGWPPAGQYGVHFSWGDPDDMIPNAPRAWLNFYLSPSPLPSPTA